jgi:hypothetical protein
MILVDPSQEHYLQRKFCWLCYCSRRWPFEDLERNCAILRDDLVSDRFKDSQTAQQFRILERKFDEDFFVEMIDPKGTEPQKIAERNCSGGQEPEQRSLNDSFHRSVVYNSGSEIFEKRHDCYSSRCCLLLWFIQCSIQIEGGTDEGKMSESLRKITESLPGGADFLRV